MTQEDIAKYLVPGCVVNIPHYSAGFKVIEIADQRILLEYPVDGSRILVGMSGIVKICTWPPPKNFKGYIRIKTQEEFGIVFPPRGWDPEGLMDYLYGTWQECLSNFTVKANAAAAPRYTHWNLTREHIAEWRPIPPEGTVNIGQWRGETPNKGTLDKVNLIKNEENKMEEISLYKPENLALAKELAEAQRNDEETQKAKAFYEKCIDAINRLDREIKLREDEKKDWVKKLEPFTAASALAAAKARKSTPTDK